MPRSETGREREWEISRSQIPWSAIKQVHAKIVTVEKYCTITVVNRDTKFESSPVDCA